MFKGSIPATMRRMLREVIDSWHVDALAVGCSGNLTIERSLADTAIALGGNDVNIYSCTVGQALAGQDRPLAVNPAWQAEFGWMGDYLDTPVDRAATMIVASDMLDGPQLGTTKDRPYFQARRRGFTAQWPRLHAGTAQRLAAIRPLEEWHTGDVGEWLDQIGDRPFASFPPFWGGGYERMFANLSAVFDWDEPSYPTLTPDRIDGLLAAMTDRPHWCLGLLERHEHLEPRYIGRSVTTAGGLPIHVYASSGPSRVVVPRTPTEPAGLATLTRGDRLTGDLNLRVLPFPQFESLRRRYLDPSIRGTATPDACFVLCDGDRVLGAFGLQGDAPTIGGVAAVRSLLGVRHHPAVYLLSDFAVAPVDYPRLSKLVVMAVVSAEVHELAERLLRRRWRGVATSVFSDNPVSMKYRGVMDLVDRQPLKGRGRSGSDKPWRLNYAAALPRWTLAEAWSEWSKRHSRTR
jgi:hypothetical protein